MRKREKHCDHHHYEELMLHLRHPSVPIDQHFTYSEEDIWDGDDDRIAEDRDSGQPSEGPGSDGWYGGSNRQGWI